MNKVFEHAGDLVNIKVAHNLMRLIGEGFGEDDDAAYSQLRSSAVCYFDHYTGLFDMSTMMKLNICINMLLNGCCFM